MNHVYNVEGMTCNHCKNSVEKNVSQLNGILSVIADPQSNTVRIEGEVDENVLKSTLEELGFHLRGEKQ